MHSRTMNRSPRLMMAGLVALIALTFTATIGAQRSSSAQASILPGLVYVPAMFVMEDGSTTVQSFRVDGARYNEADFAHIFSGPDVSDIEALAAGNVMSTGGSNSTGDVVLGESETGVVIITGAMNNKPPYGLIAGFQANFDDGDQLAIGNLSTANDYDSSRAFVARSREEVLIARPDSGVVDVLSFNLYLEGDMVRQVDSIDVDYSADDRIAAADVASATNVKEQTDGVDEILVADSDTGWVVGYDTDGKLPGQISVANFNPGDGFATGNIDGLGRDEFVIANADSGAIQVFTFDTALGDPLIASFGSSFSSGDAVALSDFDGNGMDDILVADAQTGNVTLYSYYIYEDLEIEEDEFRTTGTLATSFNVTSQFAAIPLRYQDDDGDGLYDHWEKFGLDVDNNGSTDVDLPAMGADPLHKDLFVELDWMTGEAPDRSAIQAVKEAFAAAPVDAGGNWNEDATDGINLWIDTGDLKEFGLEVGDDLGGGNEITPPATPICGLTSDFYDLKETHFDEARRLVFRYGISGDNSSCPPGDLRGGQGELGGNDFIDFLHDGGTIMHELGHTLNLDHGGDQIMNCKPNYLSVMNYDHQLGIRRADGTSQIDFSPPRTFGNSRGNAPLALLSESVLDETKVLDSSDSYNQAVFTNAKGQKIRAQVNQPLDWNGDGDTNDTSVQANVNTAGVGGQPPECANSTNTDVMSGHDDWTAISLPFRDFGDSADGPINLASDEDMPTKEELEEIEEQLHTTDLQLILSANPDPAGAGSELTYTIDVVNNGPNPVANAEVIVNLPDEVSYRDSSDACVERDGEVSCTLEQLQATDERQLTITVDVPLSLGLEDDVPAVLVSTATVSDLSEFAQDSATGNNASTLKTEVEIQSDLEVVEFQPTGAAVKLVVGKPALVEFETVVTNHGPEPSPVTATFQITEPKSGPVIAGLSSLARTEDLAPGEVRTLTGTVILTCSEPGVHQVEIVNTVGLREARIVDANPANNGAVANIPIECLTPVAINIVPGNASNPVDLQGEIEVAVLTTTSGQYGLPVRINASQIFQDTIAFGPRDLVLGTGDPGVPPLDGQNRLEDAFELDETTLDGDRDLLLRFSAAESGLEAGDTEACLRAVVRVSRTDTLEIFGCDSVTIQ